MANQSDSATPAKLTISAIIAMANPTASPISTAMFATNPRATLLSRRITASTAATIARYSGAPKFLLPAPPPAHVTPTRNSVMPITAMIVPVTIGGKKRTILPNHGATRTVNTPAPITAPNIPVMPTPVVAIAAIGPTAANVTPMTTGRRMPNFHTPRHWINVAMPQANRSALMRNAIWSLGSLSAPPMISGTAIAPAYITSTCCNPAANMGPAGKTSSTGWTRSRDALIVSLARKTSSTIDYRIESQARDLVDLAQIFRKLFRGVIVDAPCKFRH